MTGGRMMGNLVRRLSGLAFLFACMLLASGLVHAAGLEGQYKGTGKEIGEEISDAHITVAGLKLGNVPLDRVKEVFGGAELHDNEDVHEFDTLCYSSGRGGDKTLVVVFTGPECGPSSEFAGFMIVKEASLIDEGIGKPAVSGLVDKNISTGSGIGLEITPDRLVALAGEPTTVEGNVFTYHYEVEKRLDADNEDSYVYIDAWVEAEFEAGKLVRYAVWKIESY